MLGGSIGTLGGSIGEWGCPCGSLGSSDQFGSLGKASDWVPRICGRFGWLGKAANWTVVECSGSDRVGLACGLLCRWEMVSGSSGCPVLVCCKSGQVGPASGRWGRVALAGH